MGGLGYLILARAGHVIVSGLARRSTRGRIRRRSRPGRSRSSRAVWGNIYPADHEALLERLLEQGAAISEMPFGWETRGRDFPRRNRIVAGLCRAVVVVEAARRSGSLITAKFAADEGICTRAEDVIEALAEQNLSRTQPVIGFFDPGFGGRGYEPLWDELDLPGVAPFEPGARQSGGWRIARRSATGPRRRPWRSRPGGRGTTSSGALRAFGAGAGFG